MARPGRYSPANLIRSENLRCTPGQIVELPEKLHNPIEEDNWKQCLINPAVPKVIDLFCGAGGMSEGFMRAGFTAVVGFDSNQMARNTFAANIAAKAICVDIASIPDPATVLEEEGIEASSIDVIIGGPPCQGFSQVGRARIRSLAQTEQNRLLARNELYQFFFRFVEVFQPSFFVMENVPNLITFEDGAYMQAIRNESDRLGYEIDYDTIDAADYGVPQIRRRLFIIGSRMGRLFRWPRTVHSQDKVPLKDAIGDLPTVMPPSLEERLEYNANQQLSIYQKLMRSRVSEADKDFIYDHVVRPVREDDIQIFTSMQPGDRYIDIDPRFQRYDTRSFKDKYYKLRPDAPGITVTAHLDKDGYRYIHYDAEQHRTISVREAARIQSFGDHFRFAGSRSARFRMIGNAVPPIMAEKIAEQVLRAIKRSSGIFPGEAVQLALPGQERRNHLVIAHE